MISRPVVGYHEVKLLGPLRTLRAEMPDIAACVRSIFHGEKALLSVKSDPLCKTVIRESWRFKGVRKKLRSAKHKSRYSLFADPQTTNIRSTTPDRGLIRIEAVIDAPGWVVTCLKHGYFFDR
jgi:hypothetical protein